MQHKLSIIIIAVILSTIQLMAQEKGTFTDSRDGKIYKTVKIGTQTWMAENLAYKTDNGCWAYDNNPKNVTTYGYLYDFKTAKKVCPEGWHIPSDEEWVALITHLGGSRLVGDKLKTITTWDKQGANPTNSSGFSAVAAGIFDADANAFSELGRQTSWWSTAQLNSYTYYIYCVYYDSSDITKSNDFETNGHSVRCIKD